MLHVKSMNLSQSQAYIKNFKRLAREIKEVTLAFLRNPIKYRNQGHIDRFLDYVQLKNKDLLIVGLGKGGEVPRFLAEGCRKIVGVDPYPQVEADSFGPRLKLLKTPGESIPLEDETFDAVYTVATLEHVINPEKVVQEMLRLLKPGGILYCSTAPIWYSAYGYHPKEIYPALWEPWFHLVYNKAEYLKNHQELEDDSYYLERLDIIYDHPTQYNRLSTQRYYDIVQDLIEKQMVLRVEFTGINEEIALLNEHPALCEQLSGQGYDLRDLVTKGVTVVVRKRDY